MRPNTPHAVFTPEPSICHGGHFYSTSTMQDTMFGIVNTFMNPSALSNTDHPPHAILLRRIAAFYHESLVKQQVGGGDEVGHLPNLTSIDGVLDLLTFCNMMIMANVLDSRTYEPAPGSTQYLMDMYDVNAIPAKERQQMAYARGRCWDILRWFFHKYEIYDKELDFAIDGFHEIGMGYLAHQRTMILDFKRISTKKLKDYLSSPVPTKSLSRQMTLCFEGYPDIRRKIPHVLPGGEGKLAFPKREMYGVRLVEGSKPYRCKRLFFGGGIESWLKGSIYSPCGPS